MTVHDPAPETRPRAGRREWIGLAVLALPTLLFALDIGVLFLALPHLSADLGASGTQQLWVTDMYGFLLAGFMLTMGTLGDRIGHRRLLLAGAAAFGLASILAAYAPTAELLILARGLLGIAGATLGPATLALISSMFSDGRQRGIAISLWGACQFGGAALGPVVGGLLLDHFWWGSVFLLGVPVMVLLLAVGPVLLPEHRDPGAGRLDLTSAGLSLAGILPVMYGIKELAAGAARLGPVLAVVTGTVLVALFLRRQRRLADPLVDLGLFARPGFGSVLAAMALGSAALAGISLLTSQYVQSVVGLSPSAAGLWQAPTGAGMAAGVLLVPVLTRVLRPGTVIVWGLLASVLGLLLLTRVGATGGLALVVVATTVAAFGLGPLLALGTGLVVDSAPVERSGSAASLAETGNVLGSTVGLALLGTVGAAVYRTELGDSVPGGARETIGGAAAVAEDLPAEAAAGLLGAARDAFTAGLNIAAAVGAVVLVGVALAVRRTLSPNGAPPRD
ncbi:MAG TPA: MFS transporter [Actinophytocola sp.]|uniref:MFS transporter n=1 Tax=Actinophytocola sp. TaxID=1872138 RepID=UPI002DDD8E12|nr:MFS transporter [Actinophytocola sp.]HEV2780617.1 MFS transporter [Actinophytocola sp.]